MACTLEKVLGDARTLLERLKEHDTAAESLIEQSGALSHTVHSMREVGNALPEKYIEDNSVIQELSKFKPHALLTQENTQIKELQQENKELWLSLEEHQYALELIMGRYRKQMLQLMMAKKELDTKPVLTMHEDYAKEVQNQVERICEMGQVMRKAVQVDDQHFCSVRERLAQLEIENKELRDLMTISKATVMAAKEEASQPVPISMITPTETIEETAMTTAIKVPQEENSQHENSEHENSEHENSEHENSEHENSEHENSEHENSEHENSEQENSEQENSEQENSEKENSEKENSEQENSEQENSEQENSEQESSEIE